MALFRDIRDLTFGATTLLGCQEVSMEPTGDEIEHSGCDSDAIDYRGITKQTFNITVETEAGADLIRDAFGASFGGSIPDVKTAEIAEISEVLSDDSDADHWITFVGVTKRSVEAALSSRSVATVQGHLMGEVATLTLKAKKGVLTSGLTTDFGTSDEVVLSATSMQLMSKPKTVKHADFAEASMNFKATAGVKEFTGGELSALHPGDKETLAFTAVSAEGGADATCTIINSRLLEKRLTLNQGEMARWTLTIQAFSADGKTSPLTVT